MCAALLLANLLLLSGCAGIAPSTDTASPPVESPTSDRSPTESAPAIPDAKSFDGSTDVSVWNAGPNRTLKVTLAYGPGNTAICERQHRFTAEKALAFEMKQPARYAVTLGHPNGSGTMLLDDDNFDCNDQDHAIW